MAAFRLYLPPALGVPRFRLYAAGHGVSVIGGWIQQIALSWLVYRLTGSVLLLGVTGFIQQIPFLLLGPFAGAIVDRLPRMKLLIGIDLALAASALALAAMVFNEVADVRAYLVMAAVMGCLNAFEMPARQTLVSEIIDDRALLPSALALSATLFNTGRLVGPAVAGVLLIYVSEAWCFLLNAASYVAIITALVAMRLPTRPRPPVPASGQTGVGQSLVYLTGLPQVRLLLPLMISVGLFGVPYVHLMPSIAATFFDGRSGTLGLLMSASGLGALLTTGYLSMQRSSALQAKLLGIMPAALGATMIAFAANRNFPVGLGLMMLIGASVVVCANSTNILLQQSVPDAWRGRVIGLYAMSFQGTAPLGHLLAGAVAAKIGLSSTLVLNGSIILAVALVTRWRFRRQPEVLESLGHPHNA